MVVNVVPKPFKAVREYLCIDNCIHNSVIFGNITIYYATQQAALTTLLTQALEHQAKSANTLLTFAGRILDSWNKVSPTPRQHPNDIQSDFLLVLVPLKFPHTLMNQCIKVCYTLIHLRKYVREWN